MIPYNYNMVDMDGIDLADVKGKTYSGLYSKIREAMNDDYTVILYNWYFSAIRIVPSYVKIVVYTNKIVINDLIIVNDDDTVEIPTMSVAPTIEELSVNENGNYSAAAGVDGFNPVSVNVLPSLESLSITENGIYLPTTGVDGFSQVDVSVLPNLESLSVSQNGLYEPTSGVDGFSAVTVAVPSSQNLLANWDFTQSLIDSVKGLEVTISNATRDSEGIHLSSASSAVTLPNYLYGGYRTFEFEVGDCQAVLSGTHLRFFSYSDNAGLIYRNDAGGYWCFYSSSWAANSGIVDINYFRNSIVKIEIGDLYWKVYKNGDLVYSPNVRMSGEAVRYKFGQTSLSFFPCIIKNLKVY